MNSISNIARSVAMTTLRFIYVWSLILGLINVLKTKHGIISKEITIITRFIHSTITKMWILEKPSQRKRGKNSGFCLSLFCKHKLNSISPQLRRNHPGVFVYNIRCASIPFRACFLQQHQYPTIIHWWLNLKLPWRQVFNIPFVSLAPTVFCLRSSKLPNRNVILLASQMPDICPVAQSVTLRHSISCWSCLASKNMW